MEVVRIVPVAQSDIRIGRRTRNSSLYLLVIKLLHIVTVSVSDGGFLAVLLSKINNGLWRI